MFATPQQLLSEFIDDWNAGRRPDLRAYLKRVPEGPLRDELADEIGRWLEIAPTPAYDRAARAAIRADPVVQRVFTAAGQDAGLWPQTLPTLRERSKLSLPQLASRLAERFRLEGNDRARTEDYLGQLERGDLDATRVSRRLLDALGELLGVGGGSLAEAGAFGRGFRPATAGGTLFRRDEASEAWVADDLAVLADAALTPAPAPAQALDEVDRLFLGGPDA